MNREDPYRQIVEDTRQRIDRPRLERMDDSEELPPRSRIHQRQSKKKNKKKKVSFPVIRLLVLFFIMLPVTIFAFYTYKDRILPLGNKQATGEKSGYETISIDIGSKKHQSKAVNGDMDSKRNNEEEKKQSQGAAENGTPEDTVLAAQEQASITHEAQAASAIPIDEGSKPQETPVENSKNESTTKPDVSNSRDAGGKTLNNGEVKYHTVQPGETLYRLAIKYYNSKSGIEIIKSANNLKSEEIQVGQTLKIPIK